MVRVVVAKPGLDGHDLSILSGAHMTLVPRIAKLLKDEGADDVVLVVGVATFSGR